MESRACAICRDLPLDVVVCHYRQIDRRIQHTIDSLWYNHCGTDADTDTDTGTDADNGTDLDTGTGTDGDEGEDGARGTGTQQSTLRGHSDTEPDSGFNNASQGSPGWLSDYTDSEQSPKPGSP